MTPPDAPARFDLFTVRDFFDARECAEIIAEMRAAQGGPASVYGSSEAGAVEERVRRVTRVAASRETVESVRRRLAERRGEVERHFGASLGECEEPQFLHYRVGDFFVAHQDGNTPLLRLERERQRRVSVVIFLNRQSEAIAPDAYGGGWLAFSALPAARLQLAPDAGTLVAFRSETTHEVTPVTHGERYSIVSWYWKSQSRTED